MNTHFPESDDPLFDARLRALYDAAGEEAGAPPPAPGAWAGVETRLRPGTARQGRPFAAGMLGLVTGILLMGWWNYGSTGPTAGPATAVRPQQIAVAVPASPATPTSSAVTALNTAPTTASTGAIKANAAPTTANAAATGAHTLAITGNTATTAANTLATPPNPVATSSNTAATAANTATTTTNTVATSSNTAATSSNTAASAPNPVAGTPAPGVSMSDVVPTSYVVGILLPLIQAQTAYVGDSARGPRRTALYAARTALAVLTQRNDSLLRALGEPAPALALAPAAVGVNATEAASLAAVTDTTPVRQRWSVLLVGAPERSFLGLQAPSADTVAALRRTHEQGRGGWNAALLAEYRLNRRWSVAVGAGLSTIGAELRLTDRRTVVDIIYDTTTARTTRTDEVTTRAYIVQLVPEPHPTPRYNLSGQVVRFDTIWINRSDTTWTITNSSLLTNSTIKTVTPLISRHDEVTARVLRPSYRFLTVPLLVRYRLGRATDWTGNSAAPRWWADVAVGAQLQWFLGGSHLITTDGGRTFRTERVGRHDSAFRPLNVAVLGQVAFNYALTPCLSASVAPTVRWQTQSVYKASTGLTQKPAATGIQLGLRYSF